MYRTLFPCFSIPTRTAMHRLFALATPLLVAVVISGVAVADQTLMSSNVAARLGLEEAWQRSIPTRVGVSSLVDQKLFVHEENPNVYVEIVTGASAAPANPNPVKPNPDGSNPQDAATPQSQDAAPARPQDAAPAPAQDNAKVLMRIAVGANSETGSSIDQKEAERLASNEIRRMKRRGIEATMRTTSVRRVVLYSLADDGTLDARDAETGRSIWLVQIGQLGLHFGEIGVSENFVSIVNGANLIQLDAATGEIQYQGRTRNAPQFGAVNAGDFALVMTVGGGLEGYPLTDPTIDPFREMVAGQAMTPPVKSPTSSRTAWSTDRGFVYVMELMGKPSTLFRLNTNGLVVGRIAAVSGDRFFFGSDTGQVYGMRATRTGEVMWVVPFGEPFYDQPVVIGDKVMMISTYGRLFALNTENGNLVWPQPVTNVAEMLGGFGDQLFIQTMGGSLAVIDLKTGKISATFPEVRPNRLLPNTLTNRLYLVGDRGVVQCMRPIGQGLPTFIVTPDNKPVAEEVVEEAKESMEESNPFGAGSSDPFGAGTDPFGAGAGKDPFGSGDAMADPFGTSEPMSDPFGN